MDGGELKTREERKRWRRSRELCFVRTTILVLVGQHRCGDITPPENVMKVIVHGSRCVMAASMIKKLVFFRFLTSGANRRDRTHPALRFGHVLMGWNCRGCISGLHVRRPSGQRRCPFAHQRRVSARFGSRRAVLAVHKRLHPALRL
jgi:hypothetical protein